MNGGNISAYFAALLSAANKFAAVLIAPVNNDD